MKVRKPLLAFAVLFFYALVTFVLFLQKHEPGLSTLVSEHQQPNLKNTPMLEGMVAAFEIVAPFDGLGIIAVRFNTFGRINDDVITFRIKPKDTLSWVYTADYKTDQFQSHELFPFGFPLIPDSKNRTYLIQLESLSGTETNHVSIDEIIPVVASKYHYPPTSEIPTRSTNIKFVFQKIANLLTNTQTIFPLLLYLCPLFIFLLGLKPKKGSLSTVSTLIPAALILSIYLLKLPISYHWEITLLLSWLIYLIIIKASYRISVVLSLLAALFLVIQALKNDAVGVDQAGQWLYYSLLLTIIQVKTRSY